MPKDMMSEAQVDVTINQAPVGKITQIIGEAYIVHADGSKTPASQNAELRQGDIIETSETGAVNILFEDNTSFAVSENARMSIDQFTYDSAEQTGTSFFSMMQGVFVYTSGLIGKSDPGDVNIDTPVGSIGIRGTVVAGKIMPEGAESSITILDGAIAITNGSGTHEINNHFQTIALNGYDDMPSFSAKISTEAFGKAYGSLMKVANDTFSHFSINKSDKANDKDSDSKLKDSEDEALENSMKDDNTSDGNESINTSNANTITAETAEQIGEEITIDVPTAENEMFDPIMSQTTDDANILNFTATDTSVAPIVATATASTTSFGTTASAVPVVGFNFSSDYLHGTADTADDGIYLFGGDGNENFSLINTWDAGGQVPISVGSISMQNLPAGSTIAVTGAFTGTSQDGTPPATTFSFDSATNSLMLNDPWAMLNNDNPGGYTFTATATAPDGSTYSHTFTIALQDSFVGTTTLGTTANDALLLGTGADDLIYGDNGNDTLAGGGGADVLLGGSGDDFIGISDTAFKVIDGGLGADTLQLSTTPVTLNFFNLTNQYVSNIETIELGSGGGNTLVLGIKDIFEATDSSNILNITSAGANNLNLNTTGLTETSANTYTGSYNGSNVTLVIDPTNITLTANDTVV